MGGPAMALKDGLYQVTTRYFCAGFIVKDGGVTHCAPILRRRLSEWVQIARWICP